MKRKQDHIWSDDEISALLEAVPRASPNSPRRATTTRRSCGSVSSLGFGSARFLGCNGLTSISRRRRST